MRGVVAKRLARAAREQTKDIEPGFIGGWRRFKNGVFWTNLRHTGFRQVYQALKKSYKEGTLKPERG